MYKVTTPTHTFTLPIDADSYAEIQITYKQKKVILVKHYQDGILPEGMSLDGKDVIIHFTQEETKQFTAGTDVEAQVRVLTEGGDVYASQGFQVSVLPVLNEEILG